MSLKKIVAWIVVGVLILTYVLSAGFVLAERSSLQVYVNNELVVFTDIRPIMENGIIMVPLRFVASSLGARVTWDDATRRANIEKGGTVLVVRPGEDSVVINGVRAHILVPVRVEQNRLLVPLDLISRVFGVAVRPDAENNAVYISVILEEVRPEQKVIPFNRQTDVLSDGRLRPDKALQYLERALNNVVFYQEGGKHFVRYTHTNLPDGFVAFPTEITMEVQGAAPVRFISGWTLRHSQRIPAQSSFVRELLIAGVGISPGSVLAIEVVIGIGQPRSAGVGVHSGKLRLVYIQNGKSFVEFINHLNVPQPVEFDVTNVVSW